MPLDRRIEIKYTSLGRRNEHGEYEPGEKTTKAVWADVREPDLERIAQEGRSAVVRRDWRIRYIPDIAAARPSQVKVSDGTLDVDGNEIEFVTQNIREDTGVRGETRRRWLVIEAQITT